jgi:hypothetical protein
MSGAAGHLMHLYDDPNLTFGEIKEILKNASIGKLEQVTEKLDGRNIVFSWDVSTNQLKIARAAGDIKRGGMSAQELAQKFQGRGDLEVAFTSASEILRSTISSLSPKIQTIIFGQTSNKWYSAEIIYAASPNVVKYDSNSIIFHGYPIFEINKTGEIEKTDDDSGIKLLASNIETMQKNISKTDWKIHGPAIVSMQSLSDTSALDKAISEINNVMKIVNVSNASTIQDFIDKAVKLELEQMGFKGSLLDNVTLRILKKPGAPDLRKLKKMSPHSISLLDKAIKSEEKIIRKVLSPLDKAIGNFAIKILETLKSSFISDNEKEVARLQHATEAAIEALRGSNDPVALEFLNRQLERLGSTKNIKSAVEGIVFIYKGNAYKFTGAFAAANQILGFYRYKEPKKLEEKYLRNIIRLILN